MSKLLRVCLPAIAAARIKVERPTRDLEQWQHLVESTSEDLEGYSHEFFERDLARLRRLEDKLGAFLNYATPLIPIIAGVAGFGLTHHRFVPAALAAIAAFHLVATYLTAQRACSTVRLYMPFPEHVAQDADKPASVKVAVTARRLWSTEQNQVAGTELNNLIWAAEQSLCYVVSLLALAGLLLFV